MTNAFARRFTMTGVSSGGDLLAFEVEARRHRHAQHKINKLFKKCKPGCSITWHTKQPVEIYKDSTLEDYSIFPHLREAVLIVSDGTTVTDIRPPNGEIKPRQQELGLKGGQVLALPAPEVRSATPVPATPRVLLTEEDILEISEVRFKYNTTDDPVKEI